MPDKDSFHIHKIHTTKALKGGDRYILNATANDLAIKLGKAKAVYLKPGASGILASLGGKTVEAIPVLIKQRVGEEWNLVSTEYWNTDPRFRKYLFIHSTPRTSRIAFHGVSERL